MRKIKTLYFVHSDGSGIDKWSIKIESTNQYHIVREFDFRIISKSKIDLKDGFYFTTRHAAYKKQVRELKRTIYKQTKEIERLKHKINKLL